MPFYEKSAWVMALILSVAGIYYFHNVYALSQMAGETAPPITGLVAFYIILIVIAAIVAHAVIAGLASSEAQEGYDEREKRIVDKAGNWSGMVFGAGAIGGLWHYLVNGNGNMLFHIIVGSLLVSQIAEYLLQIWLYRRGI